MSHPGALRVARLGGVDLLIRWTWPIVLVVITVLLAPQIARLLPSTSQVTSYALALSFGLIFYLSVLLHEIAHAVVARRFGLGVRSITLHLLGGATDVDAPARTPWQEFAIAVVGPLTSLAIGFAAWLMLPLSSEGPLGLGLAAMAWANLVMGALNLLPGLPLDGGRVLKATIWKLLGSRRRGTVVAAWIGRVCAILALLWPVWLWYRAIDINVLDVSIAVVVAIFLWTGAGAALEGAKRRLRLPSLKARSLARSVVAVPADMPASAAVDRARAAGAGAIVVALPDGTVTGIVSDDVLDSIPPLRREGLAISQAARAHLPDEALDPDLEGEDLIRALSSTDQTDWLLTESDGEVYGVLNINDVDHAFAANGRAAKGRR